MAFRTPQISALVVLAALISHAQAQTATYTFEHFPAPSFGSFVNVAPDAGSLTERATFSAGNASIYSIGSAFGPISGNLLLTSSHTMQVTLTAAVTSINVAFAGIGSSCSIVFSSTVGNTTVNAKTAGMYGFATGQLAFKSLVPFKTFTLTSNAGYWGIDNLVLSLAAPPSGPVAVPEAGSAAALLALGAASLGLVRRRVASR
ncbi:MAG TPA: hypothetical protein VGC85_01945 [Chthoniobacterales bacterium]